MEKHPLFQLWLDVQKHDNESFYLGHVIPILQKAFPNHKISLSTEGDPEEPNYSIITIVEDRGLKPDAHKFTNEDKLFLYGILGFISEIYDQGIGPNLDWRTPMDLWTEETITHIIKIYHNYDS